MPWLIKLYFLFLPSVFCDLYVYHRERLGYAKEKYQAGKRAVYEYSMFSPPACLINSSVPDWH